MKMNGGSEARLVVDHVRKRSPIRMADDHNAVHSPVLFAFKLSPFWAVAHVLHEKTQNRTMLQGGRIYGVTLRIGRYFPGSASIIDDLLFHVQDRPGERPGDF